MRDERRPEPGAEATRDERRPESGDEAMRDERRPESGAEAMDEDLRWEAIDLRHVVQDEWVDFRRIAYRMPDGTVSEPFYNYSRRSFVVVVALTEDGRFVTVRQFRHGIGEVTVEFPAGGIETLPGEPEYGAAAEEPLTAARRELLEETGYESHDWTELLSLPAEPSLGDNYAYLFLARDCRRVREQELDETEFLHVSLMAGEELAALIRSGGFVQALHIAAYFLALEALWRE